MTQDILDKLGMHAFRPLPGINSGHAQTIASFYFPYNPLIDNNKKHVIQLSDGDKIVLIENRPKQWNASKRIVLLVHGLSGSDSSKYLVRLTRVLLTHGFVVIRMNLRGCGAGIGLAKQLYHSGSSEDTRAVLAWLGQHFPHSPVTQIGFSLGANITLKMAGEGTQQNPPNLDSIVAVSPPLDLYASVKLIIKKENKLFNDHFVKVLLKEIAVLYQHFPEVSKPNLPRINTLLEFDDLYTAPRAGFSSAIDYYQRCSSGQFIEGITLPTFILYAKDDPVISRIKLLKIPPKDNFDVLITAKGGHVGWIGKTQHFLRFRWMDEIVGAWVNWFDKQ